MQDLLGSLRGHSVAGLTLLEGLTPLHLRRELQVIYIMDADKEHSPLSGVYPEPSVQGRGPTLISNSRRLSPNMKTVDFF